ncbi:MAG: ThiF family adenylyltransferase [Acidobacteriota bacterium]|nr:ThiF family adenylyltransferase [Blastocatellia bacterium]MDW8413711.1 ThiF family adenylyltransferase [Acidobacteriota bacterium]
MNDVFARILPIVGNHLFNKNIAILGDAYLLMDYLCGCGITKYAVTEDNRLAVERAANRLSEKLGLRIEISSGNIDFLVAAGRRDVLQTANKFCLTNTCEGLFFSQLENGAGLIVTLPTTTADLIVDVNIRGTLLLDNLLTVAAALVKGRLLNSTPLARSDINSFYNGRPLLIGHPSWPWAVEEVSSQNLSLVAKGQLKSSTLNGKRILIVGLGSLGSIVAEKLATLGADLVLFDGESVDITNPIRQLYSVKQVGKPKVEACAELLGASKCLTFMKNLDETNLDELDRLGHLDFAVLSTGTNHDRAVSAQLRSIKVPHLAISCYARARYFEAIIVTEEGPCFSCIRGHIHRGPTPELTPEQRRMYAAPHELQAEPATIVETARAAIAAALITTSYLNPEVWLCRIIAEERTLLLGANYAEINADGLYPYGIDKVGAARVYGPDEIAGRGDYVECAECKRKLEVALKLKEAFDLSSLQIPFDQN